MKNLKLKLFGLLMVVFGCMMMAGCAGGTVTTTLNLNSDGSGSRVMDVAIDMEYFNSDFNGTMEDLESVISENCPESMTYTFSDSETPIYSFCISFSSIDDYYAKIKEISGDENLSSSINVADNGVWSSGLDVYEGFTSDAFFGWIKDALLDGGYVSSDNSSYIIEMDSSKIVFDGQVTNTGNYISCGGLTYVKLDHVDILTEIVDVDVYNRTYYFCVDISSIGERKDDIKAFFEGLVSDGTVEVTEDDYYVIYSMSGTNLDVAGLDAMNKALFTEATASNRKFENAELFMTAAEVEESFDAAQYICNDYQTISINEYMKAPREYLISSEYEWLVTPDYFTESDSYPGYYRVSSGYSASDALGTVSLAYGKNYLVKSIDSYTLLQGRDGIEKTLEIFFEETVPENVLQSAVDTIKSDLDNAHQSITSDDSYCDTEVLYFNEEECSIKIEIMGDVTSVSDKLASITDSYGSFFVEYSYKLLKFKYEVAASEYFSLYRFAKHATDDFVVNYTFDAGKGAKITYCSDDKAVVDKNTVSISTADAYGTTVAAKVANVPGIIIWVCVFAVIGAAVFIIIKLTTGPKAKQKKAMKAAAKAQQAAWMAGQVNQAAGPANQVSGQAGPAFCTKCGAKRENGSKFCTKCGNPF